MALNVFYIIYFLIYVLHFFSHLCHMFSAERIKNLLSRVLACPGQSGRSPEQSLEVLWQLCTTSVARVHGDEDAHGWVQANLLSKEVEALLLVSNCILNAFYLVNKSWENAPCALGVGWWLRLGPQGHT